MDILVKVSGDLGDNAKFYDWLASVNNPEDQLFVLCGGGTLITQELQEYGISSEFGPGGRKIRSLLGRLLAERVLREQGSYVKKKLKERGIKATVFIPVQKIGGIPWHMNGDDYAKALYPNCDKVYIVTKSDKVKTFPQKYKKIEVVYL